MGKIYYLSTKIVVLFHLSKKKKEFMTKSIKNTDLNHSCFDV